MKCYLSHTQIETFRTNVMSLKLVSDEDIRYADIKWYTDSDILRIRDFKGTTAFDLNNGILISCDKVGEATVTAELDGVKYECTVKVREEKHAKPTDKFNFYIGAATNLLIRTLLSVIAINVFHMGLLSVITITCIEIVIRLVLIFLRYRGGKWKNAIKN